MNRLSMSLLGGFRLETAGQELRLRNRKARAVLACLALSATGEETRERLVGLLWSESSEEKARASLRQVVHELRAVLPADVLVAERLSLKLDLKAFDIDVEQVKRAVDNNMVHAALLARTQPIEALLEGLEDLDPAFNVWLLARRQALQDQCARQLELALAADTPHQRMFAQALLNLDPTHEEACRQAMMAAVSEGNVSGALRTYEALWNILGEDFDMEPSLATQKLVADIKSGKLVPGQRSVPTIQLPATPLQPRSTGSRFLLLVETFAAHGVPEERGYLVQGFRHDLVACLARFREWFVMDGGALPDHAAAVDRVSGRYSIGGTAYQAGHRISLVLTLRDGETGIVAWSERIDVGLDTWFEAQNQLVRGIAMSLTGQISAARLSTIAARKDVSLAAHDRWLLGQSVIRGFSPEHWSRARALFIESIGEDPNFSSSYSSLAQLDNVEHIVNPGVWRDRAREERSLEMARRAVQSDPMDSRAHLCLGWSLAMMRQYDRAGTHMQLACELNPNDTWTLISAALFHSFCGGHVEAMRLASEALDSMFAPSRTYWGYQVTIAYLRGDDRATIAACDQAEDVIRTLPAWRAAALYNLGDSEGARRDAGNYFSKVREAWRGSTPPTRNLMGRWLLHLYPISTAENWERLRQGVVGAGIPDADLHHDDW
jgi:DNA-binding SARP family transcriptional activator/TolB-like protein